MNNKDIMLHALQKYFDGVLSHTERVHAVVQGGGTPIYSVLPSSSLVKVVKLEK